MADTTDKVWAIDRKTNEAGQYDPAFLDAWPNGYLRIDPPGGPTGLTGPDGSWKNDELKAYAVEHGIDLAGAKVKADILAAIAAHEPEPTDRSDSPQPDTGKTQEGGA